MAATTFPALVTQSSGNVRKALQGGVLIAPITAAIPASYTAMNTATPPAPVLQTLTGFSSLGLITTAGAVFSKSITTSEVDAWGVGDPVRTDMTKKVTTLHVAGLESNKNTIATYFNVDPSTLVPNATTGELTIPETGSLSTINYRVLVISQDGAAGSEYWIIRLLARASITAVGDFTMANGDNDIQYDMTFTAYPDAVTGVSVYTTFAGPGWLANKTQAGF